MVGQARLRKGRHNIFIISYNRDEIIRLAAAALAVRSRVGQRAKPLGHSVDQGTGGARGLQADDRFSLFHHIKAVPGNQLDILRIALE